MSSYRSAYENYYKNINKVVKGTNNKQLTRDKKADTSISSKYGINLKSRGTIIETLIKRVITELTGAAVLLLFFTGLKYTPVTQINELHIKCKQTLEQDFSYDGAIDAFNGMYIGNIQGKDIRIGNFAVEDFKTKNLKMKAVSFMEYIRNDSNSN